MRNFAYGFAVALVVASAALFIAVRFGFVDPRADVPINAIERSIAMPAMDAAVDRRAIKQADPIPPSDANLTAGMNLYQANCAVCHGDVLQPRARLAAALYPRAPQFVVDAPDMEDYENFYVIQHGVRLTGMPAWGALLDPGQIWQVVTFLSHMDKLPPTVAQRWRSAAAAAGQPRSPHR